MLSARLTTPQTGDGPPISQISPSQGQSQFVDFFDKFIANEANYYNCLDTIMKNYMLPATQYPEFHFNQTDIRRLFGPTDQIWQVHTLLRQDLANARAFADVDKLTDQTISDKLALDFVNILNGKMNDFYAYIDYTRTYYSAYVRRKAFENTRSFASFMREREFSLTTDQRQLFTPKAVIQPEMKDPISRLMSIPLTRIQYYQSIVLNVMPVLTSSRQHDPASDGEGGELTARSMSNELCSLKQALQLLVSKLSAVNASALEVYRMHKEIVGQSNLPLHDQICTEPTREFVCRGELNYAVPSPVACAHLSDFPTTFTTFLFNDILVLTRPLKVPEANAIKPCHELTVHLRHCRYIYRPPEQAIGDSGDSGDSGELILNWERIEQGRVSNARALFTLPLNSATNEANDFIVRLIQCIDKCNPITPTSVVDADATAMQKKTPIRRFSASATTTPSEAERKRMI